MVKLMVNRLLWGVPVLCCLSLITFLLMHAVPGNPWDTGQGRAMSQLSLDDITRRTLNQRFGLDKPLWQQFVVYIVGDFDTQGMFVCGAICGNLGPSYRQRGRTVQEILFDPPEDRPVWESRLGYSLRLSLLALLFAIAAGIPLGTAAAAWRGTRVDFAITAITTLGIAVPNFVFGLILIIIFATGLHLIAVAPSSWSGASPRLWVVPVVVLGFGTMSTLVRITRASVLEVMHQDYIRTARAKGLGRWTILSRHLFKNAMIPIITLLGPAAAELVTGSFIIELMFGFPGIGREYVDSVTRLDYPMVLGATLVYACIIALANLGVDITYGWLDPRLRIET